jgi:hypothetical protein
MFAGALGRLVGNPFARSRAAARHPTTPYPKTRHGRCAWRDPLRPFERLPTPALITSYPPLANNILLIAIRATTGFTCVTWCACSAGVG